MKDPVIQELFPEKTAAVPERNINSASQPLSNDLFYAPPGYYRSVLNFDTGEYYLDTICSYYISYAFPSGFAQENFLYLQLLASDQTGKKHFTRRSGLHSYLCAQTFSGRGQLLYEGKEYELRPGDVFLIDCMDRHEYRAASEEGWGYRIIHFNGAVMEGWFSCFKESGVFTFHPGSSHIFYQYTRELFRNRSGNSPASEIDEHRILTAMVLELMKQLPRFEEVHYPERILYLRHYLKEHCTEPVSLDQTAQHFHISKYHLCRDYKKHTGETVFQYVTQCRMEIATYLLANSSLSVEQISLKCGFENVNTFFYAFRKYSGDSPSFYRKTHIRS